MKCFLAVNIWRLEGAAVACVVDSFLCRLWRLAPCWYVEVNESLCLLDGTVAAATTLGTRVGKTDVISRLSRRSCSVASRRRSTSAYHCRHAVNDVAAETKRSYYRLPRLLVWMHVIIANVYVCQKHLVLCKMWRPCQDCWTQVAAHCITSLLT